MEVDFTYVDLKLVVLEAATWLLQSLQNLQNHHPLVKDSWAEHFLSKIVASISMTAFRKQDSEHFNSTCLESKFKHFKPD